MSADTKHKIEEVTSWEDIKFKIKNKTIPEQLAIPVLKDTVKRLANLDFMGENVVSCCYNDAISLEGIINIIEKNIGFDYMTKRKINCESFVFIFNQMINKYE